MRVVRKILKWAGYAVLAVTVAGFIPARFGAYGLFWKRYVSAFLTNPVNPAYDWYDPLETVSGAYALPLPEASPKEAFDEKALVEAARYAEAHRSDALIIMYAGHVVFERFWNGRQATSLTAVHSMTKTLNAILIGHAIADGFIPTVDTPAARYLTEWDTPERRGITIRHLLNMASGLKESFAFWPTSLRMQRVMGTDIVSANLQTEIGGPPGQAFAHVNPAPQLLGIIIERATHRRFGDYLAEKFWRPIGAHDAQMFVDHPGGTVHTDCCMWAAIEDFVRVGEALRTKGVFAGVQVIPPGWVDQMIQPSPEYPNYGMQIWLGTTFEPHRAYDPAVPRFYNLHSERFAAPDVFFLDGLGNQRVYVVPSRELVILRTGRPDTSWDDAMLPNLVIRGMKDRT